MSDRPSKYQQQMDRTRYDEDGEPLYWSEVSAEHRHAPDCAVWTEHDCDCGAAQPTSSRPWSCTPYVIDVNHPSQRRPDR